MSQDLFLAFLHQLMGPGRQWVPWIPWVLEF